MKIGVFTRVLEDRSLESALDQIVQYGVEAIELPAANYAGRNHCDPDVLLNDKEKLRSLRRSVEDRGLAISALNCSGNPLHPSEAISRAHIEGQHSTIALAEELGVSTVVLMSGCPGDSDHAKYPNWVTWGMQEDCKPLLEWQWREKVIPFWQKEVDFAERHNVRHLAFEMHSGFVVYNPQTLRRLRSALGQSIGANLDPSHLFWQGIDIVEAIKSLGDAIFHFHAKDTYVDSQNVRVNGVFPSLMDPRPAVLPWYYRTVGYGHDALAWKTILSALRMIGYDYVVSIEQEDIFMSRDEGLRKAIEFLKQIVISEKSSEQYW